jgi:hypothetical protein
MPMRADLFSRVAWQLKSRAGVKVYAWLPVLGFELPDPVQRKALAIRNGDADGMYRLDFTNPKARRSCSTSTRIWRSTPTSKACCSMTTATCATPSCPRWRPAMMAAHARRH